MKPFFALCLALNLCLAPAAFADCLIPGDAKARVAQAMDEVNVYRRAAGLSALTQDAKLTKTALLHACDMAGMGKYSHLGSNGSDLVRRISDQKYDYRTAVENVGRFRTTTSAAKWWYNSKGHRANMLSPKIAEIGLGVATAPDKQLYWVMVGGSEY